MEKNPKKKAHRRSSSKKPTQRITHPSKPALREMDQPSQPVESQSTAARVDVMTEAQLPTPGLLPRTLGTALQWFEKGRMTIEDYFRNRRATLNAKAQV